MKQARESAGDGRLSSSPFHQGEGVILKPSRFRGGGLGWGAAPGCETKPLPNAELRRMRR